MWLAATMATACAKQNARCRLVYHVAKLIGETTPNTQALDSARYLDEHFIQKGHLGVASGQGFYRYPDPAFAQDGFI